MGFEKIQALTLHFFLANHHFEIRLLADTLTSKAQLFSGIYFRLNERQAEATEYIDFFLKLNNLMLIKKSVNRPRAILAIGATAAAFQKLSNDLRWNILKGIVNLFVTFENKAPDLVDQPPPLNPLYLVGANTNENGQTISGD